MQTATTAPEPDLVRGAGGPPAAPLARLAPDDNDRDEALHCAVALAALGVLGILALRDDAVASGMAARALR